MDPQRRVRVRDEADDQHRDGHRDEGDDQQVRGHRQVQCGGGGPDTGAEDAPETEHGVEPRHDAAPHGPFDRDRVHIHRDVAGAGTESEHGQPAEDPDRGVAGDGQRGDRATQARDAQRAEDRLARRQPGHDPSGQDESGHRTHRQPEREHAHDQYRQVKLPAHGGEPGQPARQADPGQREHRADRRPPPPDPGVRAGPGVPAQPGVFARAGPVELHDQPLTAPADIPETRLRCTIMKKITTGRANSTDAAMSPP
ncbi:hypothetical protein Raf01_66950 [Rugosimonospora africana]|uniref:Uncharacterized protein n=1 Tax=Rugosimonospora africana TaxID=556532 RepID=A0A8J3VUE0_9ACTN|nr:hypothetical protein Raf01_66950 [Rugosimonospora africana]